ncbi:hypothetical protein CPB86DRAFT_876337 [Serendipita vermifera]|nr:hypothetical protein CPB86DRAFT_876337 [Serendipita vermifera]
MTVQLLRLAHPSPKGAFSRRISSGTTLKRFASTSSKLKSINPALCLSEEVKDALEYGRPVVALETALVTHGVVPPENLKVALSLEQQVRDNGAIPATIGVLAGRIHVGLSKSQLEQLADTKATPSTKVSKRDIAAICATRGNGGTTIAGTMVIAHMAGIKVFATGGLGGVHRGGENSMDVSADLTELGRTPVAVFSGGVKSILDIGRTLEYLETQGVPVLTYGNSNTFPAFFSPKSPFKSPYFVSSPDQAARVIYQGDSFGLTNGSLFACPIPDEYAAVGEEIQRAVDKAVEESQMNGMDKRGKDVTPWLMSRVHELTKGLSVKNNRALLENACRIGARVAVEYSKLTSEQGNNNQPALFTPIINTASPLIETQPATEFEAKTPSKVIVVGGSAVDIISKASPSGASSIQQSTVPGQVKSSLGGVGRNVAEAAHRILHRTPDHSPVLLISPIGDDPFGSILMNGSKSLGMRMDGLFTPASLTSEVSYRTAVCNMILDSQGDLICGVADMDISSSIQFEHVSSLLLDQKPSLLMIDGNISATLISDVCAWAKPKKIPVFFEPTSVAKSTKILDAIPSLLREHAETLPGRMNSSPIDFVSPNLLELEQLYGTIETKMEIDSSLRDWWWSIVDDLGLNQDYQSELAILARQRSPNDSSQTLSFLTEKGVARMIVQLLPFFQHLLIKCGKEGVILAMRAPSTPGNLWAQEKTDPRSRRQIIFKGRSSIFVLKHFPAILLNPSELVNVTGAGDSLVGASLASLVERPDVMQNPALVDAMVQRAQQAAVLTLQSNLAVSPLLETLAHSS